MEDLGTLTVRYAANDPDLANTHGGATREAGLPLTFQSRNRAIVFAKPHGNRERFLRRVRQGQAGMISQLATVIGLWNFAEKKDWEIFVGGQKVDVVPAPLDRQPAHPDPRRRQLPRDPADRPDRSRPRCRDRDRPGRQAARRRPTQRRDRAGAHHLDVQPAQAQPVPLGSLDLEAITSRTYGAFVLELGDAAQHGSFDAFVRHIDGNTLDGDLARRTAPARGRLQERQRPDGGVVLQRLRPAERRRISRSIPASRRRPSRCAS